MKTFIWRNNCETFYLLHKVFLMLNRRALKHNYGLAKWKNFYVRREQTKLARTTLRTASPQFKDDSPVMLGALPNTSRGKIDNAPYQTRSNNAKWVTRSVKPRNGINRDDAGRDFAFSFCDVPLRWLMYPYFGHQSRASQRAGRPVRAPFRPSLSSCLPRDGTRRKIDRRNTFILWLKHAGQSNSKKLFLRLTRFRLRQRKNQ